MGAIQHREENRSQWTGAAGQSVSAKIFREEWQDQNYNKRGRRGREY